MRTMTQTPQDRLALEPATDPSSAASSQPLKGVFWMLMTGFCFVAVTALVKYLGDRIPPAESAFLRYLLGLVFLVPMIGTLRRTRITTRLWGLFALRGFVHTLAVILWFFAMTQIPLAEVTAMNYLSPIYVSIGAALFLGERMALRRVGAILIALVGALIILRPGFREVEAGHMAMLVTALGFGASYLLAKTTVDGTNPVVVVAMLSIWVTAFLAPFAAVVWVTPTLWELSILFAVACFATAGHIAMTLAFASAPVTVTQPVTFLQLVWATLLGALVFGEAVDVWVVAGGCLILAAVSFITWREAVPKRRALTPVSLATKV
ncbi:DMT family transporter [Phaeobacter sp. C3_T13_0]|uniref:DMT family transporter n=1 Tax=Phaeobacter cretensis TaxID=3342641 RepID=UPI0039BD0782